ncbi:MAG: hypothetical protein HY273_02455 [Gammaproteobacteria bacterium]|nr:hypothetical protein [Gammaproteobacteria bacterium]
MNRYLLVIALVLFAQFSVPAYSRMVAAPSPEELLQSSDVVALIEVTSSERISVDGEPCGVLNTAKIIRAIKSNKKLNQKMSDIKFGRAFGIKVGEKYIIFARYISTAEEYYRESSIPKDSTGFDAHMQNKIQCNGVIPGYLVAPNYAWVVEHGVVTQPTTHPNELVKMPPSLMIKRTGEIEKDEKKLNETKLLEFLSTLSSKHSLGSDAN